RTWQRRLRKSCSTSLRARACKLRKGGRWHASRRWWGIPGRGGGGVRGRGAGARRSHIMLKHDLVLLGHLANGLGYYRFSYNGSNRAYVGVIAQEVQTVMPKAVGRDRDGPPSQFS